MINTIIFYSHAHNGEIFLSKGYVNHIIESLPDVNFIYAHEKDGRLVHDLRAGHLNVHGLADRYSKFRVSEDIMYINTWVGNYLNYGDCNWLTLQHMYSEIVNFINETMGTQLKIEEMSNYCPFIKFDSYTIPEDFEINFEDFIIFSNGPVLSGQSNIQDTDGIIMAVLENFPDKHIILTHPSAVYSDRIVYSSEVIGPVGSDLNEIGWLSSKCKYIIGRQSGPFIFMQIPENVYDSRKKMICFGLNETTDWLYKIPTEAEYHMLIESNVDVASEIVRIIGSE